MIVALALAACTVLDNPAPEEVLSAQLEALSVDHSGEGADGLLAVEGEGADFAITSPVDFVVHSPGHADLSPWIDEQVTVQANVGSEDWTASVGIEISDDAGAIWLAEPGIGSVFADALTTRIRGSRSPATLRTGAGRPGWRPWVTHVGHAALASVTSVSAWAARSRSV